MLASNILNCKQNYMQIRMSDSLTPMSKDGNESYSSQCDAVSDGTALDHVDTVPTDTCIEVVANAELVMPPRVELDDDTSTTASRSPPVLTLDHCWHQQCAQLNAHTARQSDANAANDSTTNEERPSDTPQESSTCGRCLGAMADECILPCGHKFCTECVPDELIPICPVCEADTPGSGNASPQVSSLSPILVDMIVSITETPTFKSLAGCLLDQNTELDTIELTQSALRPENLKRVLKELLDVRRRNPFSEYPEAVLMKEFDNFLSKVGMLNVRL